MRAILRYPGSKWKMAEWIISYFPEHHSYLEPFAGSLAVLFKKPRSNIETVNDLDGNVVNLFEWIKKDPERLAHEIYYTPYARQIFEDACKATPENSFEQAVNFYIRSNMSHGFRSNGEKSGWKNDVQGREKAYAATDWCNLPEKILQAAERLRGVQIENRPAVEVMRKFNHKKVLTYADPPYVLNTRNRKQYRYEMEDPAQEEFLDAALKHKGPMIISGYDNPMYNDALKDWHRTETTAYTQNQTKKTEVLWMNFRPAGQYSINDYIEVAK